MTKLASVFRFIKDNLFLGIAFLMVWSFPFSESLLSIASGLIFLQILLTGNCKEKIQQIKTEKPLWALVGVFIIYCLGLLVCRNWDVGIYELQKNIFWLLIPSGVVLSKRLTSKQFWGLMLSFVLFVTISSIIAAVKIVFQSYFQITDVRDASFVSHVAFSFQVIFSVFIIAFTFIEKNEIFNKIHPVIRIVIAVWLLVFLLFQKSLLGILSLYFVSIYFIIKSISLINGLKIKKVLIVAAVLTFTVPMVYVATVYTNFNTTKDKSPLNVNYKTALGNDYVFDFQNTQKENGYFVHWYICKEELELAWNKRSKIKIYENGATGFQIYYTLIRYITSKGLKKDSEGVNALTDRDIEYIQSGMSNYIYANKKYSLYPRIYETFWEIAEYKRTGDPNNQSLSQRFEYVNAALYLIKKHPFGIGTGNFKAAFADAYEAINTKLNEEFRFHVHNQYLSYWVKFGVLGLLLISLLLVYAVLTKKGHKIILVNVLLIIILVSNMGEAILETHMGLSFFVFFLTIYLWHYPQKEVGT